MIQHEASSIIAVIGILIDNGRRNKSFVAKKEGKVSEEELKAWTKSTSLQISDNRIYLRFTHECHGKILKRIEEIAEVQSRQCRRPTAVVL
jgi:hypothetical protein